MLLNTDYGVFEVSHDGGRFLVELVAKKSQETEWPPKGAHLVGETMRYLPVDEIRIVPPRNLSFIYEKAEVLATKIDL